MPQRVQTATLFDLSPALPDGFVYEEEFLSRDDETRLLELMSRLSFSDVRMHGVVARRRVVQYGFDYSFDTTRISAGPEVPEFLRPLRDRAARFATREPDDLSEALITEYPVGAPIGWHRDAPPFDIIVGISLLSSCRFRLRRYDRTGSVLTVELTPRSIYLLSGAARSEWQHSIPPVTALRYSITFRAVRPSARKRTRKTAGQEDA